MDSTPFDAPYTKRPAALMVRLGQVLTLALAILGGALGAGLVEWQVLAFSQLPDQIPAPHVVPKSASGTPLALAMIDDILCERFDRPGPAWYAARNRLRQAALDAERAKLQSDQLPSAEYLANLDDLSTGFDLIGEPAKGVPIQEEKLERMRGVEKAWIERQLALSALVRSESEEPPSIPEIHDNLLPLYRAYANLGTHLIHAHFAAAIRGDRSARRLATEGLTSLKLSVAINPNAHFGRETWQIVAAEFFLAAIDRPELLTTYDMLGNRWLQGPPPQDARVSKPEWPSLYSGLDDPLEVLEALRKPQSVDSDEMFELRGLLRKDITETGAEGSWKGELLTILEKPVPFDEPTLGILGMWTLGSGANPHFALALGGICERVGQLATAWRAYERASMLADRFSPEAALKEKLIAHCQTRQTAILAALLPGKSAADRLAEDESRRETFQRDLKQCLDRRALMQKFEEEEIAAGKSPDDPDFYKPFHLAHRAIRTAPQYLDLVESNGLARRSTLDLLAGILLLAGAGAMLGQLIARYALMA